MNLIVEAGPDKGKSIVIPPAGARLGRSSSNDIVLTDPMLSRFHCRFHFADDGRLCVADLGSSNQTLMNSKPVEDAAVSVGDQVTIGDTVLRVINDRAGAAGGSPRSHAPVVAAPAAAGDGLDLGLSRRGDDEGPKPRINVKQILLSALIIAFFALAFWLLQHKPPGETTIPPDERPLEPLEIYYEKEQASKDNIFRYVLHLEDGSANVRVDDLQGNRHAAPAPMRVRNESSLRGLLRTIESSQFFDLHNEYIGHSPDAWDLWDITVTIGARTHRVKVLNRLEPKAFREVREHVEEFARDEFNINFLQVPPEELRQLAKQAFDTGRRLHDEVNARYENRWKGIMAYRAAEWHLQSIDPKPDYYRDLVQNLSECEDELKRLYEERLFQAQRAESLREWEEAIESLAVIMQMIPDRDDERYRKAEKKRVQLEGKLNR